MTPPYNAASRIRAIFEEGQRQPSNNVSNSVWCLLLLGRPGPTSIRDRLLTVELMGRLYDEMQEVHRLMKESPFSAAVYEDVFKDMYQAISIEALNNSWDRGHGHITQTAIQMLQVFAETIPDEGEQLTDKELAELKKILDELYALVKSATSERAKNFLLEHIRIIERALLTYKIVGSKAFVEATNSVVEVILRQKDQSQDISNDPGVQKAWPKIQSFWGRLREKNTDVDVILKVWGGYQLASKGGQFLLDAASKLLP